jgi:hypothetical protein
MWGKSVLFPGLEEGTSEYYESLEKQLGSINVSEATNFYEEMFDELKNAFRHEYFIANNSARTENLRKILKYISGVEQFPKVNKENEALDEELTYFEKLKSPESTKILEK